MPGRQFRSCAAQRRNCGPGTRFERRSPSRRCPLSVVAFSQKIPGGANGATASFCHRPVVNLGDGLAVWAMGWHLGGRVGRQATGHHANTSGAESCSTDPSRYLATAPSEAVSRHRKGALQRACRTQLHAPRCLTDQGIGLCRAPAGRSPGASARCNDEAGVSRLGRRRRPARRARASMRRLRSDARFREPAGRFGSRARGGNRQQLQTQRQTQIRRRIPRPSPIQTQNTEPRLDSVRPLSRPSPVLYPETTQEAVLRERVRNRSVRPLPKAHNFRTTG